MSVRSPSENIMWVSEDWKICECQWPEWRYSISDKGHSEGIMWMWDVRWGYYVTGQRHIEDIMWVSGSVVRILFEYKRLEWGYCMSVSCQNKHNAWVSEATGRVSCEWQRMQWGYFVRGRGQVKIQCVAEVRVMALFEDQRTHCGFYVNGSVPD